MTSAIFAFHVFGLIKINYQGNKKISQQGKAQEQMVHW